jgi:iron complex outermembrane recepter protein
MTTRANSRSTRKITWKWRAPIRRQQGRSSRELRLVLTAILLVTTWAADAQNADTAHLVAPSSVTGASLEEVVVTASRRAESIQSVPLSITAVTAGMLEQSAANTFFDYATRIPNLSFSSDTATTPSSNIAIRGIADAGTTGFYIDETPVSQALDAKALDIARIEVLRGPQGTLYGGRSMGGTVRVITEQPDLSQFWGRSHASLSNTAQTSSPNYNVDGAVSIPLLDNRLAVRLGALHEEEAGYFKRAIGPYGSAPIEVVKNVGKGTTDSFSLSVLIKPTAQLTLTPRVLYQHWKANGLNYADVPIAAPLSPQILTARSLTQARQTDVRESSEDEWTLATFDVSYKTAFGSFVSASSYFHRIFSATEDETDFIQGVFSAPGFPLPAIATPEDSHMTTDGLTQEFRFSSTFNGPFQFVAGVFYDHQKTGAAFPPLIAPGLNDLFGGALGGDNLFSYFTTNVQTEKAAYAELTFKVTDKLSLIGGERFFRAETNSGEQFEDGLFFGGPTVVAPANSEESGSTPKASIQFRFSDDAQAYLTAAKGYRPGGNNIPIPSTVPGCIDELADLGLTPGGVLSYKSDSVWSYEAGLKKSTFDRRLTANASVFQIDWNKIQQAVALNCGFLFRGNAGSARSQGIELEISARPVPSLNISLGVGYTDAKFTATAPGTRFKDGERVPQVPHLTANVSADYSFALTGSIRANLYADYKYVGDSSSATNAAVDPATGLTVYNIRPSYSIADVRAAFDFRNYELALFVKNLTDERASRGDPFPLGFSNGIRNRVSINQPRTIGIEGRVRF